MGIIYIFLFLIVLLLTGIGVKLIHIYDCLNGIRRKQ